VVKSFSRRLPNSFQIVGEDDADELFLRRNFLLDDFIFVKRKTFSCAWD
jgi:hypothetical protein